MIRSIDAFERLKGHFNPADIKNDLFYKDVKIIENDLKALEILRRRVKLGGLYEDTTIKYYPLIEFDQLTELTSDEYDILKRMLR